MRRNCGETRRRGVGIQSRLRGGGTPDFRRVVVTSLCTLHAGALSGFLAAATFALTSYGFVMFQK